MPALPALPRNDDEDDPAGGTVRRIALLSVLAAALPVLYLPGLVHNFFDLKIYMSAMDWWNSGQHLYDYAQSDPVQGTLYFTYPPLTALLLRPFGLLPLWATIALFSALSVVAVVVTTRWLVLPLIRRHRLDRWFTLTVATLLVLALESTRETITFGQINMLLVVLILADLLFAVPGRRRWAGVGVGLATALKLFPGIFIVYLLVARRWRAAIVASATAAVATLVAAAFAPQASWRFWTHELWATDRVGRLDYTGNQSLQGMLSRLAVPQEPAALLWPALAALVVPYGMWRAGRAVRARDWTAGLALAGLVGALISPITWTHHVYWFVPALVVLVDAGLRARATPGRSRRGAWLLAFAAGIYLPITYGVVSFQKWGVAPEPTDSPGEFLVRNMYVLLALLLLVVLPIRPADREPQPEPEPPASPEVAPNGQTSPDRLQSR